MRSSQRSPRRRQHPVQSKRRSRDCAPLSPSEILQANQLKAAASTAAFSLFLAVENGASKINGLAESLGANAPIESARVFGTFPKPDDGPPDRIKGNAARLGEPDGDKLTKKVGNLRRKDYARAGQNAIIHPPVISAARDAELLAADIVREFAFVLAREAGALLTAAEDANTPAIEARLWTCRRCLSVAIASWREAVPALAREGARHG